MRAIVARAQQIAIEQGSGIVSEAHLFLAALDFASDPESSISILLAMSGVSPEAARLYAQSALEIGPAQPNKTPRLSSGARQALRGAVTEAGFDNNLTMEARHLFIACLTPRRGPHLGEVMRPLGLDAARLRARLRSLQRSEGAYRAGNPLNRLTPEGQRAIEAAQGAARAGFCGRISAAHLLLGALGDEKIAGVLQSAACDVEALKQRARTLNPGNREVATAQPKFAPDAKRAIERAALEAKAAHHLHLDSQDLLLGLLPPAKERDARRNRDSNRDAVAALWTPAQAESLRVALQSASKTAAAPLHEKFSSWKLMRFLQVVTVALCAAVGLGLFLLCHWAATGTYTAIQFRATLGIFTRYTLVLALLAEYSEGFFSGQARVIKLA